MTNETGNRERGDGVADLTSGRIRKLHPEVVAKIAAGEMILRPVSVAKELIENALDAGSHRIEVEIRTSADQFLSVADDGCGMSEDELLLAIERHATSKLVEEQDLLRVTTLGFRGEALPSIARVASLRITTCPEGGPGTELRVRGGHIEGTRPAARARGTTAEVEDLFFNSPVRKRFLRSATGEIRLIQRVIAAYGLARPDVDFRLLVDGKESLRLGAAEPEARLEQVHGSRFREKVLPLVGDHPRIRIRGWVGIPEIARAGTSAQTILVGGRWVSHPALGQALRQGYGDLIPASRNPFAILMLDPVAGSIDVNIHPTKREIRFLDEQLVFAEVSRAVRHAVGRLVPGLAGGRAGWESSSFGGRPVEGGGGAPLGTSDLLARGGTEERGENRLDLFSAEGEPAGMGLVRDAGGDSAAESGSAPMVPLWQLQDRYIVAQTRAGILIVDQHAAHERILYEKALRWLEGEEATSQQLLFPVVVQLAPGESETLESMLDVLPRVGVHVEPFGGDSVILRAVPATWGGDPAAMLRDLLDDLSERSRRREERHSALAASFACHSAIRSGAKLDLQAMNRLIDELFATNLPHGDPHGRPTYVILGVGDIDRRFGRTGGGPLA
jgi:DNA mismatch repair protein MutL